MTDLRTAQAPPSADVRRGRIGRLSEGQTAVDFARRSRIGLVVSGVLLVLTVVSLFGRGLNLGIDFEGGVSWDVPAAEFDEDAAEEVLAAHDLSAEGARIQRRSSDSGEFVKVQVETQTPEVTDQLTTAFAEAAGVTANDLNVELVSSTWGEEITDKAVRALVIFVVVVAAFIALRFEWRMALAAIVAMVHDVAIAVGLYSIFQFLVSPETVIAFLTILGYSLYDTIVVFDRIRENEARFAAQRPPYDDVVNISMNQVIVRSLATSFSSVVPVLSLLVVGAWMLGASTLSEFAIALLIGMITGAYSSIFVATPLLALLKRSDKTWARGVPHVTGETLRQMVMGGAITGRRARVRAGARSAPAPALVAAAPEAGVAPPPAPQRPDAVLRHPPRPRKKKKR
jgi:preprotein translocase subunit SecF